MWTEAARRAAAAARAAKGGKSSFDSINEQRVAQGYKPMSAGRRGTMDFLDYMSGNGPVPEVMKSASGDKSAAAALAQGNPKAAAVPVHSGAQGRPTMEEGTARNVGLDAGNRSMRAAGRTSWNDEDADAATQALTRAKGLIPRKRGGSNKRGRSFDIGAMTPGMQRILDGSVWKGK